MKKDNTTDNRSETLEEAFKDKLQDKKNVLILMKHVPDFKDAKLTEDDVEECEELVFAYPPKEYSILRRGVLRRIREELFFFLGLDQHEENVPDVSCLAAKGITPVTVNIADETITGAEIRERLLKLKGQV